jgi:hypothetical protein
MMCTALSVIGMDVYVVLDRIVSQCRGRNKLRAPQPEHFAPLQVGLFLVSRSRSSTSAASSRQRACADSFGRHGGGSSGSWTIGQSQGLWGSSFASRLCKFHQRSPEHVRISANRSSASAGIGARNGRLRGTRFVLTASTLRQRHDGRQCESAQRRARAGARCASRPPFRLAFNDCRGRFLCRSFEFSVVPASRQ